MIPSPTQEQIYTSIRSFLIDVLPSGTVVVAAQVNRVPEPIDGSFVMVSLTRTSRLSTNFDALRDVRYIGSITNDVMTVQSVDFGTIREGSQLYGVGVIPNSMIGQQLTGVPGGAGTYSVSPPQDIALEVLASGAELLTQATEVSFQLDFHSDTLSAGGDMAQVVTTMFRDEYATRQFANQVPNYGLVPLHADDARQVPFQNEQQQYEWRWIVEAKCQANIAVSVTQQYADAVEVGLIEVDEKYPP